ncbi:chlorophyll synthesis pathway protein BchC [Lasiodiplodia theobromae]|nr:chlorophyll synthesis pathway protein BchC [Lasiodiplodia theobromae]
MLKLPPDHTATTPLIMGHEIAGRIITSNNNYPALPPGTPVLIDPRLICSTCPQCTAFSSSSAAPDEDEDDGDNEPQSQGCAAGLSFVGFSTSVKGGGFASRVAVKASAVHVLPEWKGKDERDLLADAALVEPLAVAWHAVKRAGVLEVPGWVGSGGGESGGEGRKGKGKGKKKAAEDVAVLIVGGGPVGVAVAYVLRAWGVGTVVVSEPVAGRREHVRGLVDVVVDPVAESVVEKCEEVTGGRGVDVVFECAGSPRVVGDVFGSLAWRGVVVVVSLWVGEIPVPFAPLMYKESTLTSSCAYNEKDFAEVVKAFAEDRFEGVDRMITARISLEDVVQKGFEELQKPDNTHLKILVTPKPLKTA